MQRHPENSANIHFVPVGGDLRRVADYLIETDHSPQGTRYANDILNGVRVPSHELVEKAQLIGRNSGKRGILRVIASSVRILS